MKSRVCCSSLAIPSRDSGQQKKFRSLISKINFSGAKRSVRRYRQGLLGVGVLLIFCWTINAIYLINMRRSERSMEDVLERKATVALLLSTEAQTNR